MVDYKSVLGVSATLMAFVQYGPYIKDILKGKTRPHAFSWFVWGLPCGIVFAAQFLGGGGAGSWATGMTAAISTLIFVLSLFYGEKEITLLDWISFAVALLAIVWWIATKDPLLSVVLITVIDIVGFVPTMRKSIKKPREETLSTYVISGLKWILSILAFDGFSFTVLLYPVAMVVANWLFVVLLLLRRRKIA